MTKIICRLENISRHSQNRAPDTPMPFAAARRGAGAIRRVGGYLGSPSRGRWLISDGSQLGGGLEPRRLPVWGIFDHGG
jgi:hypothetical protein